MNSFSRQGIDDFILALGYRGDVIKRWLLDLNDLDGDITIDTLNRKVHHREKDGHNAWHVTALETGLNTQTGGRVAQCMNAFPGERVIATYGDGLGKRFLKETYGISRDPSTENWPLSLQSDLRSVWSPPHRRRPSNSFR